MKVLVLLLSIAVFSCAIAQEDSVPGEQGEPAVDNSAASGDSAIPSDDEVQTLLESGNNDELAAKIVELLQAQYVKNGTINVEVNTPLSRFVENVVAELHKAGADAGQFIESVKQQLEEAAQKFPENSQKFLNDATSFLGNVGQNIVSRAGSIVGGVGETLHHWGDQLWRGLQSLGDNVHNAVHNLKEDAGDVINCAKEKADARN